MNKLFWVYLLSTAILLGFSFLLFRNWRKASVYTFFLMFLFFFFGTIHDVFKGVFGASFFSRYLFILPFLSLVSILVFFAIKKTNKTFKRFTEYLNILLFVLIVGDLISLLSKGEKTNKQYTSVNKISNYLQKPDIYLIITDEYAGTTELRDIFNFDNSSFENSLRMRGFHVVKEPRSNYNYTPYSMASMLSMNYLEGITLKSNDFNNRKVSYQNINNNSLIRILSALGYDFVNLSLFDFAGHPTKVDNQFYSTREKLITSQTLYEKIYRDLGYHLILNFRFDWAIKRYHNKLIKEIAYLYNQTIFTIDAPSKNPRFIYTHLTMPHYPYLYNRKGDKLSFEDAMDGNNKAFYLGYLQYCNNQLINLVDKIMSRSETPPIIFLMSDHGFTKYETSLDPSYNFTNINMIYLPDKNYSPFYDGMTNVNQFRILLNTQFKQKLPLLKDSSIYLLEY